MEEKDEILEQAELNNEAAEVSAENLNGGADELVAVVNLPEENLINNENTSSETPDSEKVDHNTGVSSEEASLDAEYEKLREEAKWYVLHTFSGYENVAKENLEIVIEKFNLQKRIFDIIIPLEDVIEEKNGKKKVVTRKVMPGYILVKMIYGDDIWHAVTRTRGITGFVGPKGRPLHLTEDEIRKMHLEKITVVDVNIVPNDKVEVLYGPLSGFIGVVINVDVASEKCRVLVEMFGRDTPVDLSLTQIKKLN